MSGNSRSALIMNLTRFFYVFLWYNRKNSTWSVWLDLCICSPWSNRYYKRFLSFWIFCWYDLYSFQFSSSKFLWDLLGLCTGHCSDIGILNVSCTRTYTWNYFMKHLHWRETLINLYLLFDKRGIMVPKCKHMSLNQRSIQKKISTSLSSHSMSEPFTWGLPWYG